MANQNVKQTKVLNVINLIDKATDSFTRTFTGQTEHAYNEAVKHEWTVNADRAGKLQDAVQRADKEISYAVYGLPQATRGIFNPDIADSVGFEAYVLSKIITGDTTFDLKWAKEQGFEFDKESVQTLISRLQQLI